ncbi:deferrochelatase/peroxidase EfeB [Bradyrhizobium sp. AZCC 1588]|uniref:Dyp-type peroxidase n=1 Tax=unclassified Bradyrhizobium TaxID=2631580 RepID=UPI002FF1F870
MFDFSSIQGNILRGYASFPHARFLYLFIRDAGHAKRLMQILLDEGHVTPGQWQEKPDTTLNLALTFDGLRAFGLPEESLATFPAEFREGMKVRAKVLGDVGKSSPQHWDEPWKTSRVHILVMIYGRTMDALEERCRTFRELLPAGITELGPDQAAESFSNDGGKTRREHFGFADGLSNPDVQDVPREAAASKDIGNPDHSGRFRKIPLGEFILGYPGEGGDLAPMPLPNLLAHNGTYMVFRKLAQNVLAFRDYIRAQAESFSRTIPGRLPDGVSAEEFLAAKMMGRWQDGSSLIEYPHKPAGSLANAFAYADDPAGARCPLGAHVRRTNPRDALGFGGKTMSRHRLIRRGITYGKFLPPDERDDENRGIIFIAFNSGFDQFEFVQRFWVNFGDDFEQGNDTDPIVGVGRRGQMVIPGDEATGRRPFICFDIPRFVETKGGDYFFVPSLAALRLLASGRVHAS